MSKLSNATEDIIIGLLAFENGLIKVKHKIGNFKSSDPYGTALHMKSDPKRCQVRRHFHFLPGLTYIALSDRV